MSTNEQKHCEANAIAGNVTSRQWHVHASKMDIQEQIKDIKKQLRLAMNGAVSQSMREKGLAYKLNFGVELPRLKSIAAGYGKSHELAQALWKEDIRETKILAGMLQPVETFYPEIADIWVEGMHYPEIAELTCMTLFQYLPYAPSKSFEWIADGREYFQYCGFLLAARLLSGGMELNERAMHELLDQAQAALLSEGFLPRKAAALCLKKLGLQGKANAAQVLCLVDGLRRECRDDLLPLCEDIAFELE